MQKVILKEAQAPYQVALPEALLLGEVVILEKNGQSVAAVVRRILRTGSLKKGGRTCQF